MTTIRRFCRTKYAALGASLAILLLCRGAAFAQSAAGGTEAGGAMAFRKGTVEAGGIVGTALPVTWLRAHADRRLTMGALQFGRVMTNRMGHGPLGGNFEFLLEISPVIALRQPQHAFGFTVSPLHLRWNFAPVRSPRMRVFAEASGGIVYTNHAVPAGTTAFNFIDQSGFGVRLETSANLAWLAGYRFQHISNGGRVRPNPGVNFNFLYGGVTFLR